MIDTCPPNFKTADIKKKCQNISIDHEYEDVKITQPVMDRKSRIIYSNIYCAQCNGVTDTEKFRLTYNCFDQSQFGIPRISDPKVLTDILLKAKFDPQMKHFTATYNNTNYVCSHQLVIPTQIKSFMRYCEPSLISSCPKEFNDSKVIQKCHSLNKAVYSLSLIHI